MLAVPALSVLPALAAAILIVLVGTGMRPRWPFRRHLPRAFFDLPPRRSSVSPRLGLLLLVPSATLALAAGWVCLLTANAVALALAVTPAPAALTALGLWYTTKFGLGGSSGLVLLAVGVLPPVAAALVAGLTGSLAAALVLATLSSISAAGLALRAWIESTGLVLSSPPASPTKEKHSHESLACHGDHANALRVLGQNGNGNGDASAMIGTNKDTNMPAERHNEDPAVAFGTITSNATRTHTRTDSYISERSVDTLPEWSFSFACTTAGGHRESIVFGLDIPEEVEEENEGESGLEAWGAAADATANANANAVAGNTNGTAAKHQSLDSHESHKTARTARTPYRPTHTRSGSTPYGTDYSVIASYSPNPFMPLPRGFESLTSLRGSTYDTLALCDNPRRSEDTVGDGIHPHSSPGRENGRNRDTSGLTNYTFITESDGPIRLDLSSFETSNASSSNSNPGTTATLHAAVERPGEPTPDRMRNGNPMEPRFEPSPLRPALNHPTGPRAMPMTTPPFSSGMTRPPRRNPLALTLSPIPGSVQDSPSATPAPSPIGTYVDEHPRRLWLLVIFCVVTCYALNVPLLAAKRSTGTLAAFSVALFLPSPLLAIAVFYPRRRVLLPVTGSITSMTSMTRVAKEEQDASYVHMAAETNERKAPTPEYVLTLPTDLFPLSAPMPEYPRPVAEKDYPYHAYKLNAAPKPGLSRDPAAATANDNPLHGERRHTFCAGDTLPSPTSDWFTNGHARDGLSTLGRAKEMMKPAPALCVLQEVEAMERLEEENAMSTPKTSAQESTRRDAVRQSLIARLRGGIVSMIAKCDLPEVHIPVIHVTSPTTINPSPVSSKIKSVKSPKPSISASKASISASTSTKDHTPGHSRKGSKGSISHSLSSMDLSRDSELGELPGLGAKIEVATLGRRSPSSSFYLAKDKMEIITTGILTDLGLVRGETASDAKKDGTSNATRLTKTVSVAHTRSVSVDLPFRPSVDGVASTPRRARGVFTHKRGVSSVSTLDGVEGMDFSRPSNAPSATLDFSRPSNAPTIDYTVPRPTTIIDVNSSAARKADDECNESIYCSAVIAEKFLEQQGDGRKEWAALQAGGYLRSLRSSPASGHRSASGSLSSVDVPPLPFIPVGSAITTPMTPKRARVRLPRASSGPSTASSSSNTFAGLPPDLVQYLHPTARSGSTDSGVPASYRESIASLSPMEALGAEEMEHVMAMDTPQRNKYVSTPSVRSNTSTPDPGSAPSSDPVPPVPTPRARLTSDASGLTTATERKRFISNASSRYALSESSDLGPLVTPAIPEDLAKIPLPPPPAVHHPHPPPPPLMHHPHPPPLALPPTHPTHHRPLPAAPAPPPPSLQHPHPPIPAFYTLPPSTTDKYKYKLNFFESSESLAAVMERPFEGTEHERTLSVVEDVEEMAPETQGSTLPLRPARASGISGSIDLAPLSVSDTSRAPSRASKASTGSVLAEIGNSTTATSVTTSSKASKGSKGSRLGSRDVSTSTAKSKMSTSSRGSKASTSKAGKTGNGNGKPTRRSLDIYTDKENAAPVSQRKSADAPRPYSYSSPWDDVEAQTNVRTGRGRFGGIPLRL